MGQKKPNQCLIMLKEASHNHWLHNNILNWKRFAARIGLKKLAIVDTTYIRHKSRISG